MRARLASLTRRGRAFLAAGTVLALVGVVIGEGEVVRLGLLAVALPLLTALVLARPSDGLTVTRALSTSQVEVGRPVTVTVHVDAEGGARAPVLLEDQVPLGLGGRPRFVVDPSSPGGSTVSYHVRSDVRGRYAVGPLLVRTVDPFGFVERRRPWGEPSYLTVTPTIEPLPPLPLGGGWAGSGDNLSRSFTAGNAQDVLVREYRRGDDLRRVHWRTSAHAGELMVRREEQPWQSRATVLLDNRVGAHRGAGPVSSLERAVTIAGSVAVHLAERGFSVRLLATGGHDGHTGWHERLSDADRHVLLETLALVGPAPVAALDTTWLREDTHPGLLVAVLGSVTASDRPALRRLPHVAAGGLALVLDVDAWPVGRSSRRGPGDTADTTEGWLRLHRWRATTVGPHDRLATAWQSLARPGRRTASPGAGTGQRAAP